MSMIYNCNCNFYENILKKWKKMAKIIKEKGFY